MYVLCPALIRGMKSLRTMVVLKEFHPDKKVSRSVQTFWFPPDPARKRARGETGGEWCLDGAFLVCEALTDSHVGEKDDKSRKHSETDVDEQAGLLLDFHDPMFLALAIV